VTRRHNREHVLDIETRYHCRKADSEVIEFVRITLDDECAVA